MPKKNIIRILIFLIFATASVMIIRHLVRNHDRLTVRPFVYDLSEFRKVDPELISHREYKQISLDGVVPIDIDYKNGNIYLLTENYLQIINTDGEEVLSFGLADRPNCIAITKDDKIIVGFDNFLIEFDENGNETSRSKRLTSNSYFTGIAIGNNNIFVADGGAKKVIVFDNELKVVRKFKGQSGVSDKHGFILPSSRFDLTTNLFNELWVVNPGVHAIQNYSPEGRLRGYWRKASFAFDGFSGCCNPYYVEFLSDGNIVTSEKGLVRIKIHNISGEFISFVAAPESFKDGKRAPAISIDENDNIIALDFDKYLIRFFKLQNIENGF